VQEPVAADHIAPRDCGNEDLLGKGGMAPAHGTVRVCSNVNFYGGRCGVFRSFDISRVGEPADVIGSRSLRRLHVNLQWLAPSCLPSHRGQALVQNQDNEANPPTVVMTNHIAFSVQLRLRPFPGPS